MDDHFTLEINSNMELLDDNINPSLGTFDSSNDSGYEFTPLSGNNFANRHHPMHELPFMPLPDGVDDNPSFNFDNDHQPDSFYIPLTNFPTTREATLKRKSGDQSLGNKAKKTHVFFYSFNL